MGMSEIGRRLMRDPLALTVDASLAAIADAGLTRDDIDGVCTYPGVFPGAGGISGAGAHEVIDTLRLKPNWHNSGLEQAGQLGSVVAAVMAVATGLCRHVLCFRTVWEATYTQLQRTGQIRYSGGGGRLSGGMEWRIPYGAASAANWIALYCSRYMHEYGLTREQLGQIAVNNRKNAALTPYAVYKDPLTLDDYLNARMISTPLGLYDCDVPCDASVAFIISHKDTAKDSRRGRGVGFEAVGTAINERVSWDQGDLRYLTGVDGAAKMLWSRTDLRPERHRHGAALRRFQFQCPVLAGEAGILWRGRGGRLSGGRPAHRARWRTAAEYQWRTTVRRPPARLRFPARGLRAVAGRGRRAPGAEQSANRDRLLRRRRAR